MYGEAGLRRAIIICGTSLDLPCKRRRMMHELLGFLNIRELGEHLDLVTSKVHLARIKEKDEVRDSLMLRV